LEAYEPANYDGDVDELLTLYLAYLNSTYVDDLQAQLLAPNSPLFSSSTGVAHQLAEFLDRSFPVRSVEGAPGGSAAATTSANNSANTRKNVIIGVFSAVAGILLLAAIWYGRRWHRRHLEAAHQQLSDPANGTGSPVGGLGVPYGAYTPSRSPSPQSMHERRRSFFFAEDSLRGYMSGSTRDIDPLHEYQTASQASVKRTSPISTHAISQPILRGATLDI